jgi:glutamyl-tRNA reductase
MLVLVGLNHRTAPVSVRERYSVSEQRWGELDRLAVQSPHVREAMLVSTCNRTELIAATVALDKGGEAVEEFLRFTVGDGSADRSQFYRHCDRDAVRHVFRVAAGLDSMVLGEPQILGQVKAGYAAAASAGSLGPLLNRLFHRAFRAAKRVRAETGLGASSVSLARVGVQLAREIFESFRGKRVLLIGAGEMAESAMHGFHEAGVQELVVLNRSLEAAERLASRYGARPGLLDALEQELCAADIALSSVAVDRPILTQQLVQQGMAQRQGRPLLLIDLGIPRNIAPAVNGLDDAYLYDLDDLGAVAERGLETRRAAVHPAEAILAVELERFEHWYATREAAPLIRRLVEGMRRTAREEAARTFAKLPTGSPDVAEALERMADAIVAKVLHRPIAQLRAEAGEGQPPFLAEAVREVFGLEEEED